MIEKILYGPKEDPLITPERLMVYLVNLEPLELLENPEEVGDIVYKITLNIEKIEQKDV